MALEIGDEITPVRNITQLDSTYETADVTGTVTNRRLLFKNEDDAEIYTYKVTFNTPVNGITSSGTPADPRQWFWFSSEELGQETINIEPFNFNEVSTNLNQSLAVSQTAVNIINNVAENTLPDDMLADSVFTLKDSAEVINQALVESTFTSEDEDIRIQEAVQTNLNAKNLKTNQEVFQELVENISAFHAVQREVKEELNAQAEQTREQTRVYYVSKEEDHINYVSTLINANSSLPVGSVYDLKETNWEEALAPPLTINIVPEVED